MNLNLTQGLEHQRSGLSVHKMYSESCDAVKDHNGRLVGQAVE